MSDEMRPTGDAGRTSWERAKLVLVALGALVALLLVVQNQGPVETRFLFWSAEMPRFLLLAVVYVLGAATGWIARWQSRR